MKSLKSKDELIEEVTLQIVEDVSWRDTEALEELLKFCPVQNLIEYLPEDRWSGFNHLRK